MKLLIVAFLLVVACTEPAPKPNKFVIGNIEKSGCDCRYEIEGHSNTDPFYMPCGLFNVGDTVMFIKYTSTDIPIALPTDTAKSGWGETKPRSAW